MVQRYKFSIELKNSPPDLSGEPFFRTENVVIAQAIMDEAQDAIDALLNEQLTK